MLTTNSGAWKACCCWPTRATARAGSAADCLRQPRDRRPRREHPGLLRADAAPRAGLEAAAAFPRDGVPGHRRRRRAGRRRCRQPDLRARASRHLLRPGYTPITLSNASASAPAFLFVADETPLHQKLGLFEVRAWSRLRARAFEDAEPSRDFTRSGSAAAFPLPASVPQMPVDRGARDAQRARRAADAVAAAFVLGAHQFGCAALQL